MDGGSPKFHKWREVRSIIAWGLGLPNVTVAMFTVLQLTTTRWTWLIIFPLMLYPLLAGRVARRECDRLGGRDA